MKEVGKCFLIEFEGVWDDYNFKDYIKKRGYGFSQPSWIPVIYMDSEDRIVGFADAANSNSAKHIVTLDQEFECVIRDYMVSRENTSTCDSLPAQESQSTGSVSGK